MIYINKYQKLIKIYNNKILNVLLNNIQINNSKNINNNKLININNNYNNIKVKILIKNYKNLIIY